MITPDAGNYFGFDGLGDADLNFSNLVPAHTKGAVDALIDLSKTYEGNQYWEVEKSSEGGGV